MNELETILKHRFGVGKSVFLEALRISPSARGYIMGAISEVLLADYLKNQGFDVLRIKEKPKGGNNAKNSDARGDFYIRPAGSKNDKWLVIESKGLKSNSEFRGGKIDTPKKLFVFLKSVIATSKDRSATYNKGLLTYQRASNEWSQNNPDKKFPDFSWNKATAGPMNADLSKTWSSEADLKKWIESMAIESFSEMSYRKGSGPISILETHQPSTRIAPLTGIKQAAPLVDDFNIMSVDLFLRTHKHEFVFMNPKKISHSPGSPEHLYQNYIIDILVKGKKEDLKISPPWYSDINECIKSTHPEYRSIDKSQLDDRELEKM